MFRAIAAFELRYQFSNPVFWVAAAMFFLLTFGAVTVDDISIGSGGNVNVNSPAAIVEIHLVLTLFFMFVITAFVANVIVRDDESGFGPMVRSTQVSRFDYLMGRFTGAFIAAAVAFLSVPLAIWLGSLMPWVDAETVGPNRLQHYVYAYGVLALPGLFLTAAIFFAVATITRSMLYSYVAVVVFLVVYLVVNGLLSNQPELRETAAYLEPFGMAAVENETRYWTAADRNQLLPSLAGGILINRLIWLSIALMALAIAYWRFSFTERAPSARKLRQQKRRSARLAASDPTVVERLPNAKSAGSWWPRLHTRVQFEAAQVFKSPAFVVLILIGLFNSGGGVYFANEIYGTPALPLTFALLRPLMGTFGIFSIIIAIYYAGELVWRDRDQRIHEIIDATPLPNWAYVLPKILAVGGVLVATLLISVIAAMLIQLIRGHSELEIGKYLLWYLLPQSFGLLLLAILAVFVQSLSPNKYVGWAVMVLYLVSTITLSSIGFEHPLYQFGGTTSPQFSDFNGNQVHGAAEWWVLIYWGGIALVMAVMAHFLWRRGNQTQLRPRLKRLPARLGNVSEWPATALAVVGLAIAVTTGLYVFQNTNILNEYQTSDDQEAQLAAFEKKYLQYESVRQPSVTDITLTIDIFPREQRLLATGNANFVNDTTVPVERLHVRFMEPMIEVLGVEVSNAELEMEDADNLYRIYRFHTPLQPGDKGTLSFNTRRWQQGFRANGNDTRLIPNGTFLDNSEFGPSIGMNRIGLLQDRATRRKYDLPAELRPAKLEDQSARERNYVGNVDWVTSDITITTDGDQVPLAPGNKISDTTKNGRRTARFVSEAPILAFFSIQSANYAVAERTVNDVNLAVYHHPSHDYNVERMLNGMQASLAYFTKAFGPYQFNYARIVEFPGYARFAQAFAGTIPYSELIGFIADTEDPEAVDYVTYVTAHELGHQYWAHQLISADMQGGTLLVETMAQYSALMVMKQLDGEDKMRRFLKYELDSYLSARGSEAIEELPLNRVENQGYIHYRKGSLVMYLLQDRLGEERVNAMLAQLLNKYRFKGAPYATSTDLVDGFRSLARDEAESALVRDLLEKITLYDLKATGARVSKLGNGRYETEIDVSAAKFYADGKGVETETVLTDEIDIGLFMARPDHEAFASKDVVVLERRVVESGEQTIRLVSDVAPEYVGVDPYNKYVDRNGDDNLLSVSN